VIHTFFGLRNNVASDAFSSNDSYYLEFSVVTDTPTFSLIRLPQSFVELYGIVSKVKGRDESTTLEEADDTSSAETAICLLTGAVMRSGSSRRAFSRAVSFL
jgi:hypothetical protein